MYSRLARPAAVGESRPVCCHVQLCAVLREELKSREATADEFGGRNGSQEGRHFSKIAFGRIMGT